MRRMLRPPIAVLAAQCSAAPVCCVCAGRLRACTATHPPTHPPTLHSLRSGCCFWGAMAKGAGLLRQGWPPILPPPCIAYPAPARPSCSSPSRLHQGKPWVAAASSPRRSVTAAAAARAANRGSNRRHRWPAPRTGQPCCAGPPPPPRPRPPASKAHSSAATATHCHAAPRAPNHRCMSGWLGLGQAMRMC